MSPSTPLVIGHRGAPGYRPEHTRSSYELAIAQGVDAVEPDVVFTRDRVAVVRHENEIGTTTDVADRPEFADRFTTKIVDGIPLRGWFTEDFTWDELATLRCRERLPRVRPTSAAFDDQEPPLRLRELLDLVAAASTAAGREVAVVLEIKHATYFEGLGFDVSDLVAAELAAADWPGPGRPLIVESFEPTILGTLRARGVRALSVLLYEDDGRPYDLVAEHGADAPTYRSLLHPDALDALAPTLDGISVDKLTLLTGGAHLVDDAHARGLTVFTWTCRPENVFLDPRFRRGADDAAFGDYEGEWRHIAGTGVDGIFVDHPDLGVATVRGGAAQAR